MSWAGAIEWFVSGSDWGTHNSRFKLQTSLRWRWQRSWVVQLYLYLLYCWKSQLMATINDKPLRLPLTSRRWIRGVSTNNLPWHIKLLWGSQPSTRYQVTFKFESQNSHDKTHHFNERSSKNSWLILYSFSTRQYMGLSEFFSVRNSPILAELLSAQNLQWGVKSLRKR